MKNVAGHMVGRMVGWLIGWVSVIWNKFLLMLRLHASVDFENAINQHKPVS